MSYISKIQDATYQIDQGEDWTLDGQDFQIEAHPLSKDVIVLTERPRQ